MIPLEKNQKHSLFFDFKIGLVILAIFAVFFVFHLQSNRITLSVSLVSLVAFIFFLGSYILQGNPALLKIVKQYSSKSQYYLWSLPVFLWLLSITYGQITHQFNWYLVWGGLIYCLTGIILINFLKEKSKKLQILDVVLIIFLWFPIEFGWTPRLNLPPVHGIANAYKLVGLSLVIYLYFAVRDLENVGFTYRLTRVDCWIGARSFLLFMPIALLVGFPTDFIGLSDHLPGLSKMVTSFLGIAFFIALPEEILFRGVIHNLIEKRVSHRKNGMVLALTISSIIFGLAHGNNNNPPFFNINFGSLGIWQVPWVYILLATIAGYFYGWAYIKTRKVTAAAITHLLVDWFWSNFFSG
jgi:membrane protease YdiL (CAAX protease family)